MQFLETLKRRAKPAATHRAFERAAFRLREFAEIELSDAIRYARRPNSDPSVIAGMLEKYLTGDFAHDSRELRKLYDLLRQEEEG